MDLEDMTICLWKQTDQNTKEQSRHKEAHNALYNCYKCAGEIGSCPNYITREQIVMKTYEIGAKR